ncbi:unnamed protein product [Gordionus sp. m RMFG-2023]|uniref:mediator of RNA polymerase II transcription subunit 30-like n=1 Tax=Gordionus sp. m RMFG-2023 TaxID=3053472 RepID=UPI0030DF0057
MKSNTQAQPSPQQSFIPNPSPVSTNIYSAFSPNISPHGSYNYTEPLSNRMLSPIPALVSPYSNQSNPYNVNYSPVKSNPFINPIQRNIHAASPIVISSQLHSNFSKETISLTDTLKAQNIEKEQHEFSLDQNITILTQLGQNLVQEIVHKASEAFQCLKSIQLPTTINVKITATQEKIRKCQEILNNVLSMFVKLENLYAKCSLDRTNLKLEIDKIFVKDTKIENGNNNQKLSNANIEYCENLNQTNLKEYQDLKKELEEKNAELLTKISQLRCLIYEINGIMSFQDDIL